MLWNVSEAFWIKLEWIRKWNRVAVKYSSSILGPLGAIWFSLYFRGILRRFLHLKGRWSTKGQNKLRDLDIALTLTWHEESSPAVVAQFLTNTTYYTICAPSPPLGGLKLGLQSMCIFMRCSTYLVDRIHIQTECGKYPGMSCGILSILENTG